MSEKIYGQFDLETIEKLADIVKNKDLGEITIADGDKVITVKGKKCPPPAPVGMPMPMAVGTASPAAQTAPEASATSAPVTGGKAVKAPIVGTFYAAPSPDSKRWRQDKEGRHYLHYRVHEGNERSTERI